MCERELNPPDFGEWSQSDIDAAVDNLIYEVEHKGAIWDEDFDYKLDMTNEILAINFGDESSHEKLALIREAITKYLTKWAKSAVEENPDAYCQREDADVSDWHREAA